MLSQTSLILDDEIQFTTHGLIGGVQSFTGKVLGVVNPRALPADSNAQVNHTNIWPSIPAEDQALISNDFTSYNYLALATDSTTIVYIGIPWINANSLASVSNRLVTIQLNNFKEADYVRIKSLLTLNGYEVLSVSE